MGDRVLVLGGAGFIGRNLVKFLVGQETVAHIKVLDKKLLPTVFLSDEHKAAYESDKVLYKQANLSSPVSIEKHFAPEGDHKWDVVYNLAAETKMGQTAEVYKEKVLDVAIKCCTEAIKLGVPKWVEVSSGRVYSTTKAKKPAQEGDALDPWTTFAKYKKQVEDYLLDVKGISVSILRPPIVYGKGDQTGLVPRIVVAAVYQKLNEKMKWLWTKDLQMNTVHVDDLCAAMFLARTFEDGSIHNVCDSSDSTQGTVADILGKVMKIETGFMGKIVGALVKTVGLKGVAEGANEKHLKPWSDLCKEQNILNTPLSPYIDYELLFNNGLWIDGSAIEVKGFKYSHPVLEESDFNEMIDYYVQLGLFPKL